VMRMLSFPAVLRISGTMLRLRFAQRLPIAFGLLTKRPIAADVMRSFITPMRTNRAVRRQAAQTAGSVDKRVLLAAAERFKEFDKPVLLAWAPEDKFFKFRLAERLASDFPNARLERIEDSYSFVSLDQPVRTAELIASFVQEPVDIGSGRGWPNPSMTAS
jgi:pimeloyl-ACP methyl ester carboxylesterase